MVSGRLGRSCITDMKALAGVAHKLVATNFALPNKRGKEANGDSGARGFIGNVGHRNRRQGRSWELGWGPYAPKRGSEEKHAELFEAAQRVTAAMADADHDYNVAEQTALEAHVQGLTGLPGMPKDVGQLLDKRYIAATIGRGAGNPQHTDPHDFGGGLFTKIGKGPCMFALGTRIRGVRARQRRGCLVYQHTSCDAWRVRPAGCGAREARRAGVGRQGGVAGRQAQCQLGRAPDFRRIHKSLGALNQQRN